MKNKLWLVVALAACGGSGGSGSLTVDTEDPAAFCRASAQVMCDSIYECLSRDEREAQGFPDTEEACLREAESGCEDSIEQCDDGQHGYAAGPAGDCLREMDAATCNDAAEPWLDAPACRKVCAPTAGAFRLGWTFNPPTYTCGQLGVSSVAVYSVAVDGRNYVDLFDCYAGSGMTDVLPVGTYAVHLELYDPSNVRRWVGQSTTVDLDREVVDLGTVTIPVSPQ